MERSDWTPAVLITATISLATAGLVWIVAPWGPLGQDGPPGAGTPRRHGPAHVVVWAGEVAPGLKAVLGPVWGDPKPDRDHDTLLNADLGLAGESALVYFRLLVFNTTDEPHQLTLHDGDILMKVEGQGPPIRLRSLAAMRARQEVDIPDGLAFSLRTLGTLQTAVEVPPGVCTQLVVPFGAAARLETATAVATTNGTALRRRQMAAAAFRRLITDPDESGVKDL